MKSVLGWNAAFSFTHALMLLGWIVEGFVGVFASAFLVIESGIGMFGLIAAILKVFVQPMYKSARVDSGPEQRLFYLLGYLFLSACVVLCTFGLKAAYGSNDFQTYNTCYAGVHLAQGLVTALASVVMWLASRRLLNAIAKNVSSKEAATMHANKVRMYAWTGSKLFLGYVQDPARTNNCNTVPSVFSGSLLHFLIGGLWFGYGVFPYVFFLTLPLAFCVPMFGLSVVLMVVLGGPNMMRARTDTAGSGLAVT